MTTPPENPPENPDADRDSYSDSYGDQPTVSGGYEDQSPVGNEGPTGSTGGSTGDSPWGPGPDAPQQYGEQQYGEQQYGGGQQYGDQSYGGQAYGNQQYGSPQYGGQYDGGQQYGAQPYGYPQYGNQQYGNQPFYGGMPAQGQLQPYGQGVRKDPALMLVASLFIAGLGTILNGETGKGLGILAGYVVGAVLSVFLIGIPIMFGFWIWGMIDAYQGAQKYNAAHGFQ